MKERDRWGRKAAAGNQQPPRQDRGKLRRLPRTGAARLVAYNVLRDVDEREAYANLALAARIREARLDARDAALATELVAGALRGQGRYDRIIELAAGRPVAEIDERTLTVMRVGVHQLLAMRTASYAAVNESVELQRFVANPAASGFVNGVLRAIDRVSGAQWDERIAAAARTADEALSQQTSHPTWVLRALRDALNAEGRLGELHELLEADNVPPRVSAAILPATNADAAWERVLRVKGVNASGVSPVGVQILGGDPAKVFASCGLPDGCARVQDQGSQLAALAMTRLRPVQEGERWLDLCAGPGGKTTILAAEAAVGGALLRANEIFEHRAELVRNSLGVFGSLVEVVAYDGRDDEAYGGSAETFDRILVDAPCSGLGALRRRPEARWRKQPSDLPELTLLQDQLLEAALSHLAVGGVVAYVTCSPHLAETRTVIDRLMRRHPECRELDTKQVLCGIATGELDLAGDHLSGQLWPHRHGTDAMFIALIERENLS